ncbi:MAG: hypothetical protein V7K38_23400 [Nostoc sp.]|uniref:hypothetical protein n=1 Tax=Nostoc sp. TaxID=1180 RepID=UPI002FFCF688
MQSDFAGLFKNLWNQNIKPFLAIWESYACEFALLISQEAKDKSDEKMDLADAVGVDGSCCRG